MNRSFKHIKSGYIAEQANDNLNYLINPQQGIIPKSIIESSNDWEEIKPFPNCSHCGREVKELDKNCVCIKPFKYFTEDMYLMKNDEVMFRVCNSSGDLFTAPERVVFHESTGYNNGDVTKNPFMPGHIHYFCHSKAVDHLLSRNRSKKVYSQQDIINAANSVSFNTPQDRVRLYKLLKIPTL